MLDAKTLSYTQGQGQKQNKDHEVKMEEKKGRLLKDIIAFAFPL